MFSQNLDLVRSIYADWERGDYGATGWAHPDVEFVIADGPEPGSWTGLVETEEGFREVLSVWQNVRVEVDEYRELDGERILLFVRRTGRGKTSGLELGRMRTEGALLFHIRDGKVTRLVFYWDRNRAFADLDFSREGEAP
jgi:ketosteroid isomerase-like protein